MIAATFPSPSLLVVDDDDDIRDALSEILREVGYCVDTAANGQDALEYLAAALPAPNLILLDLMMPIISGWQVLEALERDPRLARIPVIVLSAFHATGNALTTQVRNVVGKPVSLDLLLGLVASYCGVPADLH